MDLLAISDLYSMRWVSCLYTKFLRFLSRCIEFDICSISFFCLTTKSAQCPETREGLLPTNKTSLNSVHHCSAYYLAISASANKKLCSSAESPSTPAKWRSPTTVYKCVWAARPRVTSVDLVPGAWSLRDQPPVLTASQQSIFDPERH